MMSNRKYTMKPKRSFPIYTCLTVISLSLLLVGILLLFIWPLLLRFVIDRSFVLTPDSQTYDIWKKNSVPLLMDFYFFNWTNSDKMNTENTRPKVEEVGPYRFMETKEKVDIVWNANDTVTFRHLKRWFHVQNFSNLNDNVFTVNSVPLSAAYVARDWSFVMRKALSITLNTMHVAPAINRKIGELLFEGYDDPLISMARKMPFLAGNGLPNWEKFGWFYQMNNSAEFDGVLNMGTGIGGTVFGKLYKWKYWSKTPYFRDECGKVDGSAGEFFPPNPRRKSISLFSTQICREMTLDYVGEVYVHNIKGYKYSAGPSLLDNGSFVETNRCYCEGECIPSGVLNVSTCRYNSPAFVSLPHFYNADSYYHGLIDGLNPNDDRHEFYIVLESITGVPLEVAARLQLNLLMQPIPGVDIYSRAPKVFFPILWFEQKVTIPEDVVFGLKLLINLPIICTATAIVMICASLLIVVCSIYRICTTNICERPNKDELNSEKEQVPLKPAVT